MVYIVWLGPCIFSHHSEHKREVFLYSISSSSWLFFTIWAHNHYGSFKVKKGKLENVATEQRNLAWTRGQKPENCQPHLADDWEQTHEPSTNVSFPVPDGRNVVYKCFIPKGPPEKIPCFWVDNDKVFNYKEFIKDQWRKTDEIYW